MKTGRRWWFDRRSGLVDHTLTLERTETRVLRSVFVRQPALYLALVDAKHVVIVHDDETGMRMVISGGESE